LVAQEKDTVIGWTALSAYSSRCVYSGVAEVSVYVKGDQRGKQVGEKLLQELIIKAEEEDIWTLQSGILEINSASIALHKKVGFRMVGFRERIAKDHNGVWQNTVLMERRSSVIGN
jgi:phosphinothricin acetyltransferase